MRWFLVAAALVGCTNKKDVESAKHSLYDTDFAVVYSAALEATRNIYPNLDDSPGRGAIRTSWHQVQFANNQDDLANPQVVSHTQDPNLANGGTSPAAAAGGMPTRLAYKRFFVRFDVMVAGGRPWRVKVVGHASEWEPGAALPTELHGMAKPAWLEGRIEALQLAIFKRIRNFAIPMKAEEAKAEEDNRTDPAMFTGVPPGAAKRLAAIKDALGKRDYDGLRTQIADDVVWSLGGAPDLTTAMATWQADPDAFESMAKLVGSAACAADGDKKVRCPAQAPPPGKYQLVLELRGDIWKVTSYTKAE